MDKVLPREVRKYIYGLAVAFVPVATYYGWIDLPAAAVILPLILALMNLTPKDVESASPGLSQFDETDDLEGASDDPVDDIPTAKHAE